MHRFLVILLILAPLALRAENLSTVEAEALERRFVKMQRTTRTLRTDFEQTVRMSGMREPVVSRGEFFYRAPDELRVTFSEPPGDFFHLSGDTLEFSRGGAAPIRKPSSDGAARALMALRNVLRGTPESSEDPVDRRVAREGDEFVVTITPVVRSIRMPEKIENRVDAESLLLRTMTITLPRGISLEYRFFNPRRNAPSDDSSVHAKP